MMGITRIWKEIACSLSEKKKKQLQLLRKAESLSPRSSKKKKIQKCCRSWETKEQKPTGQGAWTSY